MRGLARFLWLRLGFGLGLAIGIGTTAVGCGDDTAKPAVSADGGRGGSLGMGDGGRAGSGAAAGNALDSAGAGGREHAEGGSGADADGGAAVGGAPAEVCNDGRGAVVTGRVLSPSGELPLGGVTVYVPSATVDPLPNGTGCWRCASAFNGSPVRRAVTAADGRFEIENVPPGAVVPLVVQTGKWQRKLALEVVDCRENPAPEADTRLPQKQSEGNLPAIALVSGAEDTLECLLRKLGIDDSEFTFAGEQGRVRLFQGKGGMAQLSDVAGSTLTPAATLWSDPEKLGVFDLVLLGSEADQNSADKPSQALQAVHDYAAAGGRVLAQHFQNYFLSAGPPDLAAVATYGQQPNPASPLSVTVDESTPRGKALADALLAAEPAGVRGKLSVKGPRNSVQAVGAPATRLLYADVPATVQAFSVDLPAAGAGPACGRVTETELLTASGDSVANFPSGCSSTTLSPQERALAYLIFDLGACLP
jgi:hypothetical protein